MWQGGRCLPGRASPRRSFRGLPGLSHWGCWEPSTAPQDQSKETAQPLKHHGEAENSPRWCLLGSRFHSCLRKDCAPPPCCSERRPWSDLPVKGPDSGLWFCCLSGPGCRSSKQLLGFSHPSYGPPCSWPTTQGRLAAPLWKPLVVGRPSEAHQNPRWLLDDCALRPCLLSQHAAPGCGRELAEGGLCAILAGTVEGPQPLTLSPEVGFPALRILETL